MPDEDKEYKRGFFEGEVMTTLKRIEDSLLSITNAKALEHRQIHEKIDHNEKRHDQFYDGVVDRVEKLESFRLKLMGAFAVVAIIANLITPVLKDWLYKLLT